MNHMNRVGNQLVTDSESQGVRWNMNAVKVWMQRGLVVAGLLLALGAASVQAQGETPASPPPIPLNPDGTAYVETPLVPVAAEQVADEDDPPPVPKALSYDYDIYVSSPGSGQVLAISYADEDVLRYTTKTKSWTKVFDGSNEGLPDAADIDALAFKPINLGQVYYLSFDTPVTVPGLGLVDDSDIVAHTYVFGQGATWSLYFDGSAHGLTTDAEDVDAIEVDGSLLKLSTLGSFSVPKAGGGTLKGADEDIIAYSDTVNAFGLTLDGTTIGLDGTNDIRAYATLKVVDDDLSFYGTQRPAQLRYANSSYPAVALSVNDIGVEERPLSGSRTFGVLWDASGAGFPKVDAFDLVKK